ncbi:SEP domain [Arabidopsis suecica]|uniref:SEP domain n=1 Tax=Arabidopsis suecica TaxID=45249 RepID=A0A8T2B9U2_ARASU|nr:SEP domain [Arabidopsis suecica]
MEDNSPETTEKLISSFIEGTSSSREVAISFLETHQWNLNAAVSTFTKNEVAVAAEPNVPNPSDEQLLRRNRSPFPNLRVIIPNSSFSAFDGSSGYSPSRLQLRPPFPSYPSRGQFYLHHSKRAAANPFSRQTIKRRQGAGNVRIDDFSGGTGSDSDEAVENYGGEEIRDIERPEQSSRSMSEETDSPELEEELEEEPQEVFTYTVTSWSNGFTVDDSSLKTLDDPENAYFLEIISNMESPRELAQVRVQVKIIRREEENFTESQAGSDSASTEPPALAASLSMRRRAKESAIERCEQSSKVMSGETDSAELQEQQQEDQPYKVVTSTVTIWKNGFTIDDDPFKSLDDPENASFLERITSLESPRLLDPLSVQVKLIRREGNFSESPSFQDVERTLTEPDSVSTELPTLATSPPPSMGLLVVDPTAPTTSIQLRLADGTSLVTQFNTHHTIRDLRGFIDASRPDGSKDYELLIMGSPPTPLLDFDQTIEKAGITNSVLVQKF